MDAKRKQELLEQMKRNEEERRKKEQAAKEKVAKKEQVHVEDLPTITEFAAPSRANDDNVHKDNDNTLPDLFTAKDLLTNRVADEREREEVLNNIIHANDDFNRALNWRRGADEYIRHYGRKDSLANLKYKDLNKKTLTEHTKDGDVLDILDVNEAKTAPNVKYHINVITTDNAHQVINNPDVKIISIHNGTGFRDNLALTGEYSIGNAMLENAQTGCNYVLYNTKTGELFQYKQSAVANDTSKHLEDARANADKYYYTGQQEVAKVYKKMEDCENRLTEACKKYGIELDKSITTDQYALIQPILDEYEGYTKQLERVNNYYSSRVDKYTKAVKVWENKQNSFNSGYITASEYSEAISTINYAKELEKAVKTPDARKAFEAEKGFKITSAYLESVRAAARDAQFKIDTCNGDIIDIDGFNTLGLNSKAQEYIDTENSYLHSDETIAKYVTKNLDNGQLEGLQTDNSKQINSIADIVRHTIVNVAYDKNDAITNLKALYDDLKGYGQLWIDETQIGKTDADTVLTHGWSGMVLNEMADASGLLNLFVFSRTQAAGFGQFEGVKRAYTFYNDPTVDIEEKTYSFKHGVLGNEQYYREEASKARSADSLAREAALRGDLDVGYGDLINSIVESTNTNGLTTQSKNTNWFLSMVAEVGAGFILDPTTYVGISTNKVEKALSNKSSEIAAKYTDDIIKETRNLFNIDDIERALLTTTDENVRKIYLKRISDYEGFVKNIYPQIDNVITDITSKALKNGDEISEALFKSRVSSTILNSTDFIEMVGSNSLSKRGMWLATLDTASAEAIKAVSKSDDVTRLWKEGQRLATTAGSIQALDKALNAFQFGALGLIGAPIGKVAKQGLNALKATKVVGDLSHKTALFCNQLAFTMNRALHKGSAGLTEFNTLSRAFEGATTLEFINDIKAAIKRGDALDTTALEELKKFGSVSRSDFGRVVINEEFNTMYKTLTTSDAYLTNRTLKSLDDCKRALSTARIISEADLDDMFSAAYGLKYSEYIDYCNRLSRQLEDIDSGYNILHTVEVNRKRIEHAVNKSNDMVRYAQLQSMKYAIKSGTDEAIDFLRTLDLTDVPEMQRTLEDILNGQKKIKDLRSLIDEYEDFVAITTVRNGNYFTPTNLAAVAHDVKYATPRDYVEACLNQVGVSYKPEDIDKIVSEVTVKFNENPEALGKYYIFKNSAETNFNNILDNEELVKFLEDEHELYNLEVLQPMRDAQYMSETLRDYMTSSFGTAGVYHMYMDTITGSADEVNDLFRRIQVTKNAKAREDLIDSLVNTIAGHAYNVQKAANNEQATVLISELARNKLKQIFTEIVDYKTVDTNISDLVVTRDSIYCTIQDINEKLLKGNYDIRFKTDASRTAISSKLERILNFGAYSTNNAELGTVLSSGKLDDYIRKATGNGELTVNHMQAIWDVMNGGSDVGLRTLLDTTNAKYWVKSDIVDKLVSSGHTNLMDELNDYVSDLRALSEHVSAATDLTVDDLDSIRRMYINACSELTEPRNLRYIEYFNSIDFTDTKKALTSIKDFEERMGINVNVIMKQYNVDFPELTVRYATECANEWHYVGHKRTGNLVNLGSDKADNLLYYKQYVDELDEQRKAGQSVLDSLLARREAASIITDEAGQRAMLDYNATRAERLNEIYDKFNFTEFKGKSKGQLRRAQIEALRNIEDDFARANVSRITRMGKDELDNLLVRSGNFMLCDTAKYNELSDMLLRLDRSGDYIITRVKVGDEYVQCLSLDISKIDATRKEFLRTAQFVEDAEVDWKAISARITDSVKVQGEDMHLYENLFDAYEHNKNTLGRAWTYSQNGSLQDLDFMATIQNQLPTNCQLDGTWKDLWSSSYTCNILLDNQVAHEIGAIKGSMLGSWYYAGVSEVTRATEIGDIYTMMASKTNSLGTQLKRLGVDINDTRTVQDILARGDYHIVTMDTTLTTANITKSGRHTMNKYGLRVLDDATNFSKYADATLVDGETFRYLSGEVIANNRAMRYLTDPAGLVKVADAFDNIRSAYVTGMLYASNFLGTGFRNIMDSNWKALNELGADKVYAGHWLTMVDQQNTYVHMMQQVYEETGKQGVEGITEWLAKHADDVNAENLTKWHTCFSLTETANDDLAKVYRMIDNKRILDTLPELGDKEVELVNKAFKNVRDKNFINKRFMNESQMYDEVVKELKKAFGTNADNELITKIANKYGDWNMGNVSHWYTKMFDADNRVGAALSKLNKTTFDNAEVRCRNAMLMTLMERGEDAISANRRVIKTQFDYGTKLSKGVNAWDKVMPFAKYQFSNAAYWLDTFNYSSFAGANARRISQLTNGVKSTSDALKMQFAYNYLANKYGSADDDKLPEMNPVEMFKNSLRDTINNYKGTPNQYVQGVSISDHRFLKVGNGFMDTMDWLQTVFAAVPQIKNGEVPKLIADTMFSPFNTIRENMDWSRKSASNNIVNFLKGDWNVLKEYNVKTDKSWYYDILNMVPVFGNLANMCITDYKSILANDKLFALTMQHNECKDNLLTAIGRVSYDFGFGILNSIVGLKYDPYDNRKVFKPYINADGNKVYWRDLTDEQKQSYIYHPVLSVDSAYYTNPTNLYSFYGRLAKMGLNKEDISLLTKNVKWANEAFRYDNNGKMYLNSAYVETVVIDMLNQGYTINEISYLMLCRDKIYDLNTHSILTDNQELMSQMLNKAFLYDYQQIPEYIRYQPDMYAEMMERYKALGYTTAEAWIKMRYDFEYIDENGNLTKLTAKQAAEYSKWLRDDYYDGQKDNGFFKYYETLPDYIKYEKGAYSRTLAYLKQMFTTEEAQLMIKNGAYYTVDGRLINCTGLTRKQSSGAFQDDNGYWHKAGDFQYDGYWFHKGDNPYLGLGSFEAYWNTLPDYTKYTKGCYKNTNAVMKAMGLDYNTRSKLIQDGNIAMQCDPNDPKIQALLANAKQTTVIQQIPKQVPLRECSLVNGQWVWNGAQVIKCTNTGDGIATETVQVNLEHYAASLGITKEQAWKSYGAAMVTVNVPTTVTTLAKPDGSIGTVWTDPNTGKTWVIVKAPDYHRPRKEYAKVGYPEKQWKDWNDVTKPKPKKITPNTERVKRVRGYWGMNQNPMVVNYSNVSTYSKNYFMGEQGVGYEKWAIWGDGNITNHRNRNGRFTAAPSTYRNPRAYQSTMYKKLYGKYGASRMNQRQNIAGYSNASVTKLHRNEIANRTANLRYSGRR